MKIYPEDMFAKEECHKLEESMN